MSIYTWKQKKASPNTARMARSDSAKPFASLMRRIVIRGEMSVKLRGSEMIGH
jgi:hypothetical protein